MEAINLRLTSALRALITPMCGKLKEEEQQEGIAPHDKVTANRWGLIPAQISVKGFGALNEKKQMRLW